MTFAKGILAALALAAAVGQASATELEHWPAPAARQLNALIEANANKGAYAVFDMDNTSYRYDLEESLLPYLEMKGVLTRDRLDPSLKLIRSRTRPGTRRACSATTTGFARSTTWSAIPGSPRCSQASPSGN